MRFDRLVILCRNPVPLEKYFRRRINNLQKLRQDSLLRRRAEINPISS
jgi:hypothetical protein